MRIKVAKYIADFFADKGVSDVFTITGGGAMHLNDAFGHHERLRCTYNHHEQACAMAAESYARLTGRIALVCVTSGPGGTNAITGVMGGWVDSIPMFIISGQVKRETTVWSTGLALRQLGDQEFPVVEAVKCMTKYAHMVTEPESIRYHLEKAWFLATNGRKGPVWLDIPVDVQGSLVDEEELWGFQPDADLLDREHPIYDSSMTEVILRKIKEAKRPVIYAGSGIRLGNALEEFYKCIEMLGIPVVMEWNAYDLLWNDHPLYAGRPGNIGTRGGNFMVQCSDLILALGTRLNIRQVSYNYKQFAPEAYKIVVDIDEMELLKPTFTPDLPIHADVKDVLKALVERLQNLSVEDRKIITGEHNDWVAMGKKLDQKYPAVREKYYQDVEPVNPYVFIKKLYDSLEEGDNIVCGNGSACVVSFQAAKVKPGQRMYTNNGCAAMGYGFPAAIGACAATKGKRVICIDGDGSFQMNLQELQTVVYNQMNLKLFIINNNGYHSIRQTQRNLFQPPLVGVCEGNGLSFPDLEKLAYAYGIHYIKIQALEECDGGIVRALSNDKPVIVEVVVSQEQNFEPKLSSKLLPDGTMVSPDMDDMYPFLPEEEYLAVHEECAAI
ncbi:MAG: thiamine pyrophosphate-binding protein [Ruminococcus flavefaciens]|nr:thiamine pyrophosphate-binding protein [Ruminococcus flavefaciens]